jgi:hypothetical protein
VLNATCGGEDDTEDSNDQADEVLANKQVRVARDGIRGKIDKR